MAQEPLRSGMAQKCPQTAALGDSLLDVCILGAGLSGISAAWHVQNLCRDLSWSILEARAELGGTWDLFRYPGIRSDSDMVTLGYRFRPWTGGQTLADGPSIKAYIEATARETGIDRRIRFQHRVIQAEWSSRDACWRLQVQVGPEQRLIQVGCRFLYCCTGYYDFEQGHAPRWAGQETFGGQLVHPQHWPEGLSVAGKRVVVIGSGATAVTLVPALARTARHVTMLQRSPTYIMSLSSRDRVAEVLSRVLPPRWAYPLVRLKNVVRQAFFYQLSRRAPGLVKGYLEAGVREALGPDYPVEQHFRPTYQPWDQRVCLVPDGDLFQAIRSGRASVVTDHLEHFTPEGIRLRSGGQLEADVVVSATGLTLRLLGGVRLRVDGQEVDLAKTVAYKGLMYSGVPNLFSAFGYTNASWTLKCDLLAEHACRLLRLMARRGLVQCTPEPEREGMELEPLLDFSSGYVQRALSRLPRQGTRAPWRLYQNYFRDVLLLRYGGVEEGLVFRSRAELEALACAPGGE